MKKDKEGKKVAIWIDEFLFRGKQPGSDGQAGWHLRLAADGTDEMGQPFIRTKTMNMQQAIASGRSLPNIINAINTQALADLEAASAKLTAISAALDADDMAEAKRLIGG